jgi:hypothetical protein
MYTSHPLPILHPTTPQAFPFARTSSGKISAGYSQGTVSHVAPNMNVNMKIIEAAAAPYCDALVWLVLSMASLDIPPARNMAIPWPTDPQYNVHLRPMRSRVKTQIRVENCVSY